MMSSRMQRSSISPFRSRRTATPPPAPVPKPGARPATASSSVSGRPTTPSSASSSTAPARPVPKPSPSPPSPVSPRSTATSDRPGFAKAKENVTVTVRFRPLSMREINKGDEIAWYADGDFTVRNEYNVNFVYGFDRVFGPATTTRHVYDVAAQHVVSSAMEGINGTVFAYGVTSSGKTHTMHGEQKSPGIIPLAVKDVFSIIQETPGREFLLRVSYLEIYNEVINDLLDPAGQNLRIREDSQGTYVEGIKEEVVLSPAHALSLIASGEEHRHVGSNNFNLLSSRSHTIFTLTIESSPSDDNHGEEDVRLSQLNLIDLAGSESSKTETTGLRRKEGSYINKSLLTLGTVIGKLTDGKATHIPYRDSKLTRLLQSSLSGHGRIALICTVTPASSNTEETHNTLKFAHKCKNVEIKASQNKIIDEKSLIKKYQREISCLKQELQQLKRGMMENPYVIGSNQEDLVNLKLQLEAGQVKLQSRLEEEEQAKAALLGRIQRLTKLILVSTKNNVPSNTSEKAGHWRRHSFGEDELAYLPDRKREYFDDDHVSLESELSEGRLDSNGIDESIKFDKKNRMRGMLGWFKSKKPDQLYAPSNSIDGDCSGTGSPSSSQPLEQRLPSVNIRDGRRKSVSRKGDDTSTAVSFTEMTQAGDLFSAAVRGRRPPRTGTTIIDQMDLLHEQVKMLAGEVAFCTSSLKRLSEQAASNPEDLFIKGQMQNLTVEINEKKLQMRLLEQKMVRTSEVTPHSADNVDTFQTLSKLAAQLNEKTFEVELMSADNRILQEQLQIKISENAEIGETVLKLKGQLSNLSDKGSNTDVALPLKYSAVSHDEIDEAAKVVRLYPQMNYNEVTPTCTAQLNGAILKENSAEYINDLPLKDQVVMLDAEIANLKQEKIRLTEEKEGFAIQSQKFSEETSYANELAAAAAVELRNLSEEVTKLSYQNARLSADLAAAKDLLAKAGSYCRKPENDVLIEELREELFSRCQKEASLEAALLEKEQIEARLRRKIDEAKQNEQELENELANMWVHVAKMKRNGTSYEETLLQTSNEHDTRTKRNGFFSGNDHSGMKFSRAKLSSSMDTDNNSFLEEMHSAYENERRRCEDLEGLVTRLKGEDIRGLDIQALEELQSFHVEALSKICQEKLSSRVL